MCLYKNVARYKYVAQHNISLEQFLLINVHYFLLITKWSINILFKYYVSSLCYSFRFPYVTFFTLLLFLHCQHDSAHCHCCWVQFSASSISQRYLWCRRSIWWVVWIRCASKDGVSNPERISSMSSPSPFQLGDSESDIHYMSALLVDRDLELTNHTFSQDPRLASKSGVYTGRILLFWGTTVFLSPAHVLAVAPPAWWNFAIDRLLPSPSSCSCLFLVQFLGLLAFAVDPVQMWPLWKA